MIQSLLRSIVLIFLAVPLFGNDKEVFLTILARNKEHMLPTYLSCIEALDYDKKLITVYINTNNNDDATEELLANWSKEHEEEYKKIIFESHTVENLFYGSPHEWTRDRLKTLALIRNKSLYLAKESGADFYFVVDCDNFLIPSALSDLVAKDLPIVAPMLKSIPAPNSRVSNFFFAVTAGGFYKKDDEYDEIFYRRKIGTFKVPLVHCTYLVKAEYLDKLSYTDKTSTFEFIIFARNARKNGVDQYVCNEKEYGYNIDFRQKVSLEEEQKRFPEVIPKIQALHTAT